MGRVCYGLSLCRSTLLWAEFVMCRVCYVPSLCRPTLLWAEFAIWAEMSSYPLENALEFRSTTMIHKRNSAENGTPERFRG